jgi:hypothetical protein
MPRKARRNASARWKTCSRLRAGRNLVLLPMELWLGRPNKSGIDMHIGKACIKKSPSNRFRKLDLQWAAAQLPLVHWKTGAAPICKIMSTTYSRQFARSVGSSRRPRAGQTPLGRCRYAQAGELGMLLDRSSPGPPPRPRTLVYRLHSRFIDQATRPVAASRFVMASGAGGTHAVSTKAPGVWSSSKAGN